jgi:hypothetical protein
MQPRLTKTKLMQSKAKKQRGRVSLAYRLRIFFITKNQALHLATGATATARTETKRRF